MTTYVTGASTDTYADLWRLAVQDTGMAVSFVRPGTAGNWFGDTIADLLVGSGRAQPCLVESPREVTRADLGRLQVGLERSHRDVVVMNAERLSAADACLLDLCASRAGVSAYLVGEGQAPDIDGLESVSPHTLLEEWSQRATCGGRRDRWDCQKALSLDHGLAAACDRHGDAVECVLEWFPHAVVTANASPPAVRARLYQLTRVSDAVALRVWQHARDVYYGARLVAAEVDLPDSVVRNAAVMDLSANASTITWKGKAYPVPAEAREILRVARADKLADGFGQGVSLFQVRTSSVKRFQAA